MASKGEGSRAASKRVVCAASVTVKVLRYHPDCGSSNPAAQVALRCNLDVQCTDRVHVFSVVRSVTRWRDKRRARSCGLIGGGIFDEDGDDLGLDEILEQEADDEDFAEHVAAPLDEPECFEDAEELEQEFLRDEASMFPFGEGPEDERPSATEEDPNDTTYASHFEAVEEELEVFLRPEDEAGLLEGQSQQDVAKSVFAAFRKMFQDSANQAHYQADYSTKAGPSVGAELPEQAVGIERLRESEKEGREQAQSEGRLVEFLADAGRRTLIRLQTAANRTSLKKLPEMVFQMIFQHECYMSHQTWTIFCRALVWLGHRASRRRQLEANRSGDLQAMESDIEPDFMDIEGDEGDREREPEEVGGLLAVPQSEGQEAGICFVASPDKSQRLDWLHRGSREPLASMGIYHYSMFVCTVRMQAATVQADDFECYVFADTHPDCATRVQKLRLGQMFRVPRLFGFTMPRFGASDVDSFRNTMFKSVLFRPFAADPDEPAADEVAPFMELVDASGSFVGPWLAWFQRQQVLASRFHALQSKAGKLFTIEDVDLSGGELEDTADAQGGSSHHERIQPTTAEFMANITVDVVTNLELAAEARAGMRVSLRPDAK